jgi:hypothetical protein
MEDDILSLLDPTGNLRQQAEGRARSQGLLNLGFALLQSSRGQPGQGRPSLGQVLGQAGPVGLQAYQQTFDRTLQDALRGMQVQEMQKKRQQQEAGRTALQQAYERMYGLTPQGALAMPSGQAGPTVQRAEMIGQRQPMSQQELLGLAMNPNIDPEAAKRIVDVVQLTTPKERETFRPLTAEEIRARGLPTDRSYQISSSGKVDEVGKGPLVSVTLPGSKKVAEVLGSKAGERLDSSLTQAQEAQSTIQNINELRPVIEQGVFSGPLSGAPRAVAQIASQFGVTGKDTKELLERTAVAMQGLAKFELSAAAAMRGQGAITENERMLIQRAAGGRLDQFTAPEVQVLLTAMEKTANYRIASHNRQLDVLRKSGSPEVRDLVPFYELGSMNVAPAPTAASVKKYNPKTGRVE